MSAEEAQAHGIVDMVPDSSFLKKKIKKKILCLR